MSAQLCVCCGSREANYGYFSRPATVIWPAAICTVCGTRGDAVLEWQSARQGLYRAAARGQIPLTAVDQYEQAFRDQLASAPASALRMAVRLVAGFYTLAGEFLALEELGEGESMAEGGFGLAMIAGGR